MKSVSVRIDVEPEPGDLAGDYVVVETNAAWNGKIGIEVYDEIPGDMAQVIISVDEAKQAIEALQRAIAAVDLEVFNGEVL